MDEELERQVALGLREGRADAWRALYDAFAERVWRVVARLAGPCSADVADVVQETFLAAARSAHAYDPQRGTLWAWLWGIAHRQAALHHRKKGRHDRLQHALDGLAADGSLARWLDGKGEAPEDVLAAGELAELVRTTLTELPADYGSLLTAKYLEGEPVERIASRERSTGDAVRSKLARAREAFRRAFGRRAIPGDRPAGTYHDPAGQ
jgi:RNA polymerase sigma-70 factor (ECF subfamily)